MKCRYGIMAVVVLLFVCINASFAQWGWYDTEELLSNVYPVNITNRCVATDYNGAARIVYEIAGHCYYLNYPSGDPVMFKYNGLSGSRLASIVRADDGSCHITDLGTLVFSNIVHRIPPVNTYDPDTLVISGSGSLNYPSIVKTIANNKISVTWSQKINAIVWELKHRRIGESSVKTINQVDNTSTGASIGESGNEIYAVWGCTSNNKVYFDRTQRNGVQWIYNPDRVIDGTETFFVTPRLAIEGQNIWVATAEFNYATPLINILKSTDNGITWPDVNSYSYNVYTSSPALSITASPGGNVYLVFQQGPESDKKLRLMYYNNNSWVLYPDPIWTYTNNSYASDASIDVFYDPLYHVDRINVVWNRGDGNHELWRKMITYNY